MNCKRWIPAILVLLLGPKVYAQQVLVPMSLIAVDTAAAPVNKGITDLSVQSGSSSAHSGKKIVISYCPVFRSSPEKPLRLQLAKPHHDTFKLIAPYTMLCLGGTACPRNSPGDFFNYSRFALLDPGYMNIDQILNNRGLY